MLSVIRSSRVYTIQGLLKYSSEWKDSRDFRIVRYIVGVHFSEVSVKQGSTVSPSNFTNLVWACPQTCFICGYYIGSNVGSIPHSVDMQQLLESLPKITEHNIIKFST